VFSANTTRSDDGSDGGSEDIDYMLDWGRREKTWKITNTQWYHFFSFQSIVSFTFINFYASKPCFSVALMTSSMWYVRIV
jgi:hypothetical protein